jgi:hypothetical protein
MTPRGLALFSTRSPIPSRGFTTDGAYDQDKVHEALTECHWRDNAGSGFTDSSTPGKLRSGVSGNSGGYRLCGLFDWNSWRSC